MLFKASKLLILFNTLGKLLPSLISTGYTGSFALEFDSNVSIAQVGNDSCERLSALSTGVCSPETGVFVSLKNLVMNCPTPCCFSSGCRGANSVNFVGDCKFLFMLLVKCTFFVFYIAAIFRNLGLPSILMVSWLFCLGSVVKIS